MTSWEQFFVVGAVLYIVGCWALYSSDVNSISPPKCSYPPFSASIGCHHFNLTLLKSWGVKVGTSYWPHVDLREGIQSLPILAPRPEMAGYRTLHIESKGWETAASRRRDIIHTRKLQWKVHSRCSSTHSSIPWKRPLWMSTMPTGYRCLSCTNQWKLFPSLPCRSQRQQMERGRRGWW